MNPVTAADREHARAMLQALGRHPRVTTDDGTVLDFPGPILAALEELLEATAEGESAMVLRANRDLTTAQAATVLGVSRPTVVRLIESGKLDAHMVGTHRRLSPTEVLAYRTASAERRRQALDEMMREAEELGLYG